MREEGVAVCISDDMWEVVEKRIDYVWCPKVASLGEMVWYREGML